MFILSVRVSQHTVRAFSRQSQHCGARARSVVVVRVLASNQGVVALPPQVRLLDTDDVVSDMSSKVKRPLPSPTHRDTVVCAWVEYAADESPDVTWDGEILTCRWSGYTPQKTVDRLREMTFPSGA